METNAPNVNETREQRRFHQDRDEAFAGRPSRLRKRWWLWIVAVLLVVGGGLLAYLQWGRPAGGTVVPVRRGTIRGTVSATGEVVSPRQAQISSRVSGEVVAVSVEVGQEVVSGTLLVAISTDALSYQVREAALRVEIAQLHLEQSRAGAQPEEISAAESDLALAQARLAQLQTGATPDDVAVARQDVVQAEAALVQARATATAAAETARLSWETAGNALRDAQDDYSRLYWENEQLRQRGIELSQAQKDAEAAAWRRVQDATAAMEQGRLAYERAQQDGQAGVTTAEARLAQARVRLQAMLSGPTPEELAQAQAQVDRAQANLDLVRSGASTFELQILEQELAVAELGLEEAQSDLERATVTAPFTGTVLDVAVEPGEVVGTFSPLLKIADLEGLEIQARIDEVDVGQVLPGQPVTVTLDAYPGRPLRGFVGEVAPAVTVDRGSAYYLARIALERAQDASPEGQPITLRLGMAANLTIVTVEKDDVLLIPRRAAELVGEGFYVTVLRAGRRERVRVTLGIGDAQFYEVVSGVEEGEQVVVP
jgi:RND family efflux transporter MFP subunit